MWVPLFANLVEHNARVNSVGMRPMVFARSGMTGFLAKCAGSQGRDGVAVLLAVGGWTNRLRTGRRFVLCSVPVQVPLVSSCRLEGTDQALEKHAIQ